MLTLNIKVVTVLAAICCFTPSAAHAGGTQMLSLSPQQKVLVEKHGRQFARLWLGRRQKRVTPQLLQILRDDPSRYLRERVVMALGRLEDPAALPALQKLLVKVRALGPPQGYGCDVIRFKDVPPYRVQLAIGRIKARRLKGTPKLNTIARELGKSWPSLLQDAKKLRLKLQERMGVYEVQQSDERFILEEFYDVLYRMGKRGENIRQLGAFDLAIWKQETTKVGAGLKAQAQGELLAASLSNQAEIEFWLRRALPPGTAGFSPAHLLDLGPQVPITLKRYLRTALSRVQANPQLAERTSAYKCLFDLAAATNDKSFIPILQGFQKLNGRGLKTQIRKPVWIKIYAARAEKRLERGEGLATVRFPS